MAKRPILRSLMVVFDGEAESDLRWRVTARWDGPPPAVGASDIEAHTDVNTRCVTVRLDAGTVAQSNVPQVAESEILSAIAVVLGVAG